MPYKTGDALDTNAFLQELVSWLSDLGWTAHMNQADGTGWRAHLSKNGMFVNLLIINGNTNPWEHALSSAMPTPAANGFLHFYAGGGYDGGVNWNAQPGGPKGNGQTYTIGYSVPLGATGVESYAFYSDAEDNICVVFKSQPVDAVIYSNFGWGRIEKSGEYPGGEYFFAPVSGRGMLYAISTTSISSFGARLTAHCPCAFDGGAGGNESVQFFLRADVDSFTDKWLSSSRNTNAQNYTGKNAVSSAPGLNIPPADIASYAGTWRRTVTEATMAVALLPLMLWAPRDAGGYSLMGAVPGIYPTDAASDTRAGAVEPGTVIQYGEDEYVLYPNFAVKRVP